MIASAAVGAVLILVSERRSTLYTLGQLLVLMWLPVVSNLLWMYYAKSRRPRPGTRPPLPAFDETAPFVAHAELAFDQLIEGWPERSGGEHRCLLLLGTEGFTARFIAPEHHTGGPLRVAVQFLSPDKALEKLTAGTAVRVAVGRQYVGAGRVMSSAEATK